MASKEELSRTGCAYHPAFLEHGLPGHPESPHRLRSIVSLLKEAGTWDELVHLEVRPATRQEVTGIHTPDYLRLLEDTAQAGGGYLDLDTYVVSASFRAAILAAGATLAAVEVVLRGQVDNAFVLIRPPGHHALPARGMGFCLLNNLAIAAQHALEHCGLERILIFDFDAHHGNGTQASFYRSPRVLYFSTHRYPFYPGTGHWRETGEDAGKGFTVNVPLSAGVGDAGYMAIVEGLLQPLAQRFQPELILVSAGYDAHFRDPLARMQLSTQGYFRLVQRLVKLAERLCQGRLVLVLEGGYHLEALAWSVLATFHALLGKPPPDEPLGGGASARESPVEEVLVTLRRVHGLS